MWESSPFLSTWLLISWELNPFMFIGLAILAIALMIGALFIFLNVSIAKPRMLNQSNLSKRLYDKFVVPDRYLAEQLDMDYRTWMTLRGAGALVGLVGGFIVGIPIIIAGGTVAGFFIAASIGAGIAEGRLLKMDRALGLLVEELASFMERSNMTIDQALREAAKNPSPELANLLLPLTNAEASIIECLIEVSDRAHSLMTSKLCSLLLFSRHQRPKSFIDTAQAVLAPVMYTQVAIQEENLATLAYPRTGGVAMGIVLSIMFLMFLRVEVFRTYYFTAGGQLVIIFVAGIYFFLTWIMNKMVSQQKWLEWDLRRVRKMLEELNVQ